MLCPWECYSRKLKDLDEKWNRLEKQLDVNFNKLFQRTLELVIDFRFLKNPVDADLTEKFQSTISRIKFTSSEMEVIENLLNLEKWDLPMPRALLSGKLILRGAKSLHSCEYKLLQEEDEVINSRIVSLMELFANTDSEEASQMVLNSLDTYKKLLIIEPELQNKLSCRTVDSLIRSLLIVLCHRKEFDQLNSMIKLLPLHRKIQIIYDESKTVLEENYIRIRECKLFICAAILQDLLQSEFARTRDKQSSLHFNIHVNLLIDLAQNESFIDRQLERLLLSANDLSVSSDYYYFAANTLRLKMPSRHETLVIKLISIGISHDLSFLEQIKYTKDNSTTKYDEKDFVAGYRKLFMALLTLGSIVKDYGLRRLCIQAASVCEPETNLCEKILSIFPEVESTNIVNYDDEMRKTLMQLRELLETFQSAIKMKISLPNTWRQASVICYDNMDFFYRRIRLSDDLKPLEYPGVEKYLKRPRTDSSEELQVPEKEELDAKCILEASKTFAADISSRFKRIQNPLTTKTSEDIPIPSEINAIFIKTLRSSADFELENGEIFMKLSDALSLESMKNYLINWFSVQDEIRKGNKPHLFFDFELKNNEELDCDKNTITNTMYQEGVVRVRYLSQSNFNIFDIENIMLYTIMNKKRLYMKEEFTDFNQNKVVDENTNQAQHAFNYIICRVLPEHSRLLKIIHIGLTSSSIYEYCLDNYTFDGIPGRYKYVKKNQEVTFNQETVTSESGKSKPEKVTRLDKQRKPGPAFRTKKEEGAQSGIIADTAPAFRTKKEERAQSGIIAATETFHASEEVMGIFALLENELSKAAGSKVTLNLKQFTDESSVHKIHLTYKSSTQLITTREKTRNNRVCHTSPYEFDLPARIHGCFTIAAVWNDTIAYDENNDNPVLQSVAEYTITGNIKFDHTTLNAKDLQIECTSGDFSGVIKLEFRMGSRSRYKGETSRDSRDCNRSSFESSPQKSYEISMSKLTPRKYIEKKSTRDKASLSSPTQQIDQLLYQAPVQIVNQMIPQIFNGSINETFNPDLTITSIVSQNHSGCFNNEQQSEISTTPAQYNEVVVNNVVKIEPGFEEQFDLVSSSIQDLPEVTIQMIPKAEKIIKVEKVSPSESNEHLDSFTNNSTVHNQVLPYKVHNTCVSTRTNKVPIILPGGTFDNFEEMILASEVAKPSNAIKLETQTPPRSPPPVGFPEVFNRRAHYESIEIKKGIDLSAERIMSQTPPEDFVDLTSEIDEPYAVKRIRPCPRSKKLLRKNTLELNVLGQSFCDDISSSEEQKRELQKQYKKVLQKERAKAPKIVHRERNSNKNSTKKCQVLLVNVLKQLSHPKANINVNFETFTMNQNPNQVPLRPDHKEYILRKADSQPLEQGPDVKTFNESTFHLIYQNSDNSDSDVEMKPLNSF